MPRPTKLTPTVRKLLCGGIEKGLSRRLAAQLARISEETLRRWLRRGEHDLTHATSSPYAQLVTQFRAAEAACAVHMLDSISDAAETNWKAAAWVLERRFGYTRTHGHQVREQEEEAELDGEAVMSTPEGRTQVAQAMAALPDCVWEEALEMRRREGAEPVMLKGS